MPIDKDDIDPPVESTGDKLHRVVRAGLGLLPVGSGTAVELFGSLITPPLERRRQKWMVEVTEALQELESQNSINMHELFEDEEFISTLIEASAAAIRNHEQEKLAALKAAVVNTAAGAAPEFSKREIYLRYVGELTLWHLKILSLFNDPEGWMQRHGDAVPSVYSGARTQILESAFPQLRGQRSFYDQLWKDLYSRGLLNTDSPHAMMTGTGLSQPCTTDPGKEFLSFITHDGEGI